MFETLDFYPGKDIPFEALLKRLVDFKYTRQEQVSSPGEFAKI